MDVVRTYFAHPRRAATLVAFWTVVGLVAGWYGWLWPIFVYWIVPLVWLYPVLDIWSELSDHLDATAESRNQEGVFFNAIVKGHETFHAVHHLYPSVPYYRLRDLNDDLQRRGIVIESARGPLDFLRIVYGRGSPSMPRLQSSDSTLEESWPTSPRRIDARIENTSSTRCTTRLEAGEATWRRIT